jgi:hypothetical protein
MLVCTAASVLCEWKLDDAYIAFAYAQNWVQGHGVVFNVGERVEGYTGFLWVVLSALGLWCKVGIVHWSTALGILSALATIAVTWRLTDELAPPHLREGAVFTTLIVGAYPATWWWSASGMETSLFMLLITAAIWRHLRDGAESMAAPVCLALASMTRPEAWLLSVLLCLDAVRMGSWRAGARYAGVFLALFGPYYGWRCWYYGYPLPNTFYAKVGDTSEQVVRGALYLLVFLVTGGGVALLTGAGAAVFSVIGRRAAVLFVFLAGYLGYVIAVGGDAFAFFRFLLPIVPLLSALATAGILCRRARRASRPCAAYTAVALYVVVVLLLCVPGLLQLPGNLEAVRDMDVTQWRWCAHIKQRSAPDEAVAAIGVGVIKYCTRRRVIDMVGLTDVHIAHRRMAAMGRALAGHEKFDSAYVLAQRPRFIIIPAPDHFPQMPAADDMRLQPLFQRDYVPDRVGFRRID